MGKWIKNCGVKSTICSRFRKGLDGKYKLDHYTSNTGNAGKLLMMLKRLIFGAFALLMTVQPSFANDRQARAVSVVEVLLTDAHRAQVSNTNATALRGAVSSAFAFDIWERFLIEDHAEKFSSDQRQQFTSMLPGFLANLYNEQFGRGLNQAPVLGQPRKVRRDTMVASQFPRNKGGNLKVEWRVRDLPDRGSRVIDVMVGGTSFLLLKREEFGNIITRDGAEGLLAYMRENSL